MAEPRGDRSMVPRTNRNDNAVGRRDLLRTGLALGAGTIGAGLWADGASAFAPAEGDKKLKKGDAAILRFLAAAEIIEADLWQQYNELGGIQDSEVPGGSGSDAYTDALAVLDEDLPWPPRGVGRVAALGRRPRTVVDGVRLEARASCATWPTASTATCPARLQPVTPRVTINYPPGSTRFPLTWSLPSPLGLATLDGHPQEPERPRRAPHGPLLRSAAPGSRGSARDASARHLQGGR
jgi:hypothetical protein